SVEMKDLLFFVHSDHVFELCFHKAKTPISMVPFSMIFLGEFSIAIYTPGQNRRGHGGNGTHERKDLYPQVPGGIPRVLSQMEDETKSLGNRTGGPQRNHKQRRADAHIRLQQLSCFLPILPAPPELHARRIKNEAHL
ncbi:MAG: hypothetical protein SO455_08185, partial [Alistipes senegalensis]|nr:hypothetical protein [Alistipes senegalensis]